MSDLIPEEPRRTIARSPETRREIVLFVQTLLAQGMHDGEMKKALKEKYGYHWTTCQDYIIRARKLMNDRTEKNLGALKAEQKERYDLIYQGSRRDADKLRAIERICELYGLNAPDVISGPDGGPVQFSLTAAITALQQAKQSPPALGDE